MELSFDVCQENARRRALGLPVEGEDTDEHDPFSSGSNKQKEEEEKSEKGDAEGQKVAWSYSSYMDALEKEDILNKTNEDTFSCLSGECMLAISLMFDIGFMPCADLTVSNSQTLES